MGTVLQVGSEYLATNVTSITRSMLQLGAPLAGFATQSDDFQKQTKVYHTFMDPLEEDVFAYLGMESTMFESFYRPVNSLN